MIFESQYCSRRLKRVRKAVGMTQKNHKKQSNKITKTQKNKKTNVFNKIVLSSFPENPKALETLLFQAERSWAFAMQLKAEESSDNARKKHHMMKCLKKAASFANALKRLCLTSAASSDDNSVSPVTQMETKAYAARLTALVHLEKHQWKEALDRFVASKAIYEELQLLHSTAEGPTAKAQITLCQAAVDDMVPAIRYCAYNLNRGSSGDDQEALVSLLQMQSDANPSDLVMATQLTSLLKQNLHANQTIEWRSVSIPVGNSTVAALLHEIEQLWVRVELQVSDGDDGKQHVEAVMSLFDQLIGKCWEASKVAEKDLKEHQQATVKVKSSQSDAQQHNLRLILGYVTMQRLTYMLKRTQFLAGSCVEDQVTKLDTAMIQTVAEMTDPDLPASVLLNQDQEASRLVGILHHGCLVQRTMHASQVYLKAGDDAESLAKAFALLHKASDELTKVESELEAVASISTSSNGYLDSLTLRCAWIGEIRTGIRGLLAVCQAQLVMKTDSAGSLSESLQTLDISSHKATVKTKERDAFDLANRLDEFVSLPIANASKKERIQVPKLQRAPAGLQPIPMKPILYDLAYAGIEYPIANIQARSTNGTRVAREKEGINKKGDERANGFLGGVLRGIWSSK